jgi:hypothetical protein
MHINYHTTCAVVRSTDIANYRAEQIWQETRDLSVYFKAWEEIYNQSLKELSYNKEGVWK